MEYFQKTQIDRFVNMVLSNYDIMVYDFLQVDLPAFRYPFPLFYQRENFYRELETEIFCLNSQKLLHNENESVYLEAVNLAGCIATGKSLIDAFTNFLQAYFECQDARHLNNRFKIDAVSEEENERLSHIYSQFDKDFTFQKMVDRLINDGWYIANKAYYNTILFHPNSKVTFTIPNYSNRDDGHFHQIYKYSHLIGENQAHRVATYDQRQEKWDRMRRRSNK